MNKELIISPDLSLMDALLHMDKIERKLLVVCDDERFVGVLSIGDIQRALLAKIDLSSDVVSVIRKEITFSHTSDDLSDIREMMLRDRIECMPVVDNEGRLADIIEWEALFGDTKRTSISINSPVVIMAGGKGTRLKPLTNVLPKPLIPISDKTIIEEIIDRFSDAGAERFYVSINYKADVIKEFFRNKARDGYKIEFIEEREPLGTAGSLAYLKGILNEPFFVTNCDILVDVNINDMVNYHKSNRNIATVVSVIRKYHIPYGTMETQKDGLLVKLTEKPTLSYQVNSGLYYFEPEIFDYIRDNEPVNITDVFQRMIDNGGRVGVFPVSEGSWVDIGNWNEYLKIVERQ